MSKISKLLHNPKLFFKDMLKKINKRIIIKQNQQSTINKWSKPQSFYLNKILSLKADLAVDAIKYKDIYLWPFLRNELQVYCDISWKKQIRNSLKFNPYQTQLCKFDENNYEKYIELSRKEGFFTIDSLCKQNVDFLFFTNLNSTDDTYVDNKLYNRLIDPIYEKVLKIGRAEKIQLVKATSQAIEKFVDYCYKPIMLLPELSYEVNNSLLVERPQNILKKLKKHISFIDINNERLNAFFDWQLHMIKLYSKILEKLKPKVVFFHPYYYYAPLIQAAKSYGIKTIDIQHGIMHGYNEVFYDNWQEYKFIKYDAIPDYFLVWSQNEFKHIEKTFAKGKAIISGYPWLKYQLNLINKQKYKKHISLLSSFNKIILITLQRDSILPKNIKNMIVASSSDIGWIIRKHPKGLPFEDNGIIRQKNVIANNIFDSIPLALLFSFAHFNFTSGSTTVLEADYYKCKSYVYGNEGIDNYKEYIDSGFVGVISDEDNKIEDLKLDLLNNSGYINYFLDIDLSVMLKKILNSC